MSWYLQVFTRNTIEPDGLLEDVQLAPRVDGFVAHRSVRGEPQVAFTVDGPLRVEREATVSVDGRWLEDEGWRADLIDAFVASADRMRCIYAQAAARRNVGHSGGRLWFDGQSESWFRQAIDRYGSWQGLPRNPVWLAWFGAPYRDLGVGTPPGVAGCSSVTGRAHIPTHHAESYCPSQTSGSYAAKAHRVNAPRRFPTGCNARCCPPPATTTLADNSLGRSAKQQAE